MLNNTQQIVDIIENELKIDYYSFSQHNPTYTLVKFGEHEVLCRNDATPQDFRAKVAERMLDHVLHLLKVAQGKVEEKKAEVRKYNEVYNKYHDIVADISDGKIETLEPIAWENYSL